MLLCSGNDFSKSASVALVAFVEGEAYSALGPGPNTDGRRVLSLASGRCFYLFFTVGSGEGHHNEQLLISSGFFVLHAGVLSWLAWRGLLYHTWWAWALNIGVAVGLFAGYEFFPWYRTPRDSTYQRYNFVRGSQRYVITLETPRHSFDVSDVTNQENGSTTSLLMGDYQVRHDTIFLREWAGPRQCFIYNRTLVSFDKSPQAIPLTREKDIAPWTLW